MKRSSSSANPRPDGIAHHHIGPAYQIGNLSKFAYQDFAAAIRFQTNDATAQQVLFSLQAQIESGSGIAGIWARVDTAGEVDLFVSIANSWESISTSSSLVTNNNQIVLGFQKNGTAYKITDSAGDTLQSGTLSSATVDYTTSGTPMTYLGAIRSETQSDGVTSLLKGILHHVRITDTPGDLATLLAEVAGTQPSTPATLTKPTTKTIVHDTAITPQGDAGIRYVSVAKLASNNYDGVYSVVDSSDNRLPASASSTDGETWSSEAVITGLSADTTIAHVLYERGKYWVLYEKIASSGGAYLYQTADHTSKGTEIKDLSTSFEAKSLYRRLDGRLMIFYVKGQATNDREVGAFISHTHDPSGTWSDLGILSGLEEGGVTDQRYSFCIIDESDGLRALCPIYNSTSTKSDHLILFGSADDGLTWTVLDATWLSSQDWLLAAVPTDYNIVWEGRAKYDAGIVYVTLLPELHGVQPNHGVMGKAS